MSVTVKQVLTKRDLRRFVNFPNRLYKGNKYYVPKLFSDEMSTLSPKKNPAFEFSQAALYLAYKDGKLAGRVAAIINNRANETWNHKEVRFGWIDFIDDREVSKALIDKVIEYGKAHGMESISGPLGFTDFDPEGMLVEGFDQRCTMVLIYNHPYYPEHLESFGFKKEVDWLEFNVFMPDSVPERIGRITEIAKKKYGVHVRKITKREVRKEGMGQKIFELINLTYGKLYNFTQLSPAMIDDYVDTYLGLLDLDYVCLVENDNNELVGVAIAMPGITGALQKSKGRLFPFGWYYLVRSMYFKHEENVEMLLIGVKPEYQNKGLVAVMFDDLIPRFKKAGYKFGETNAELESNIKVQSPWDMFDKVQNKRRRIYTKNI